MAAMPEELPVLLDDLEVLPGDVVAGKYVVERVLGVGGMACVVSARHVELDQLFALKFLAKEHRANPATVARFSREARAACKIKNRHVVRVHDVGSHDGAPFLVMEQLRGRDLGAVLLEEGPLEVERAVLFALHACEALAAAHALGIVHRDIKPENLFLAEDESPPVVKLLDFGISKLGEGTGDGAPRLTGQLALGTPCYMSPEQIRSTAAADERSDQWSLGVVLYELLTGTQAFPATTVSEACAAVLEKDPRPLWERRPDVAPELAAILARCMAKNPRDRFADVAELAARLAPFAPAEARGSSARAAASLEDSPSASEPRVSVVRACRPVARRAPANPRWTIASDVASTPSVPAEVPSRHVPLCAARRTRTGDRRRLGALAAWVLFAAATAVFLPVLVTQRRGSAASLGPPIEARTALDVPPSSPEQTAIVLVAPERPGATAVTERVDAEASPPERRPVRKAPVAPSKALTRPPTSSATPASSAPQTPPPQTPPPHAAIDLGY